MIIKQFGKDFDSSGGALTLRPDYITDNENVTKGHWSKKHKSGWTISGEMHEDYYRWVNEFNAQHPDFGAVWGNFEDKVYADSEEAFEHFYKNHPPQDWDYGDI